jgi:hypothetical protein
MVSDLAAVARVLDSHGIDPVAFGFDSTGVNVQISSWGRAPGEAEDIVDRLAVDLALEPDNGSGMNYTRRGDLDGVKVTAFTGRTRSLCSCGAACTHGGASS